MGGVGEVVEVEVGDVHARGVLREGVEPRVDAVEGVAVVVIGLADAGDFLADADEFGVDGLGEVGDLPDLGGDGKGGGDPEGGAAVVDGFVEGAVGGVGVAGRIGFGGEGGAVGVEGGDVGGEFFGALADDAEIGVEFGGDADDLGGVGRFAGGAGGQEDGESGEREPEEEGFHKVGSVFGSSWRMRA